MSPGSCASACGRGSAPLHPERPALAPGPPAAAVPSTGRGRPGVLGSTAPPPWQPATLAPKGGRWDPKPSRPRQVQGQCGRQSVQGLQRGASLGRPAPARLPSPLPPPSPFPCTDRLGVPCTIDRLGVPRARPPGGHGRHQSLWPRRLAVFSGSSGGCVAARGPDGSGPHNNHVPPLPLLSTSPPERPPDLCFLTAPRTRNPTLPAPTVSWAATQTAGGSDSATSSEQRPGDRVPPSNASGTGVGKDLKVTVPQPPGSLLQRETRKERRVLPERPSLFPTAMLRHSFRLTCRGHSSGALEPSRGVTTHDQCRSLSSVQNGSQPPAPGPRSLTPRPRPPWPLAPGPPNPRLPALAATNPLGL